MPTLFQSLLRDLGHLRIIAQLWGVELSTSEIEAACGELAAALLNPSLAAEVIESLPAEARTAFEALIAEGGRIQWAAFVRRFGEVREIGAGRRDREQPHLHPISAAETLFYHALFARAFFDTPSGPQEFAYIPDDLLLLIHHEGHKEHKGEKEKNFVSLAPCAVNGEPLGRPATPKERAGVIPASDRILDDACTLLAALRLGIEPPLLIMPTSVLLDLLSAGRLVEGKGGKGKGVVLLPDAVKAFLEAQRGEALNMLVKAWLDSETFNELRQVPGLIFEGEWQNPVLGTRNSLLGFLAAIPVGKWWSLNAFANAVKQKHADFQRPAGDYDSWFIKRASDGEYLRGFAHWDDVDGALIRYLISGPMHWLGLVELAAPEERAMPAAFRLTTPGSRLPTPENGRLHAASNGRIAVPRLVPRAARYQISRFCEWEEEKPDEYHYRVTPAALKRAKEQRLKVDQLLTLLRKHAAAPLPPPFVRSLQRWEINGTEAWVDDLVVLRVSRPEVLEELRKSRAARFLGETLGSTAVIVKKGAQPKVLAALAELGLLAEVMTTKGEES